MAVQSIDDVRKLWVRTEGSLLRAWLRHFDVNNDQRVTFQEFDRGMRALGCTSWQEIRKVFNELDGDHSGVLSLQEIDKGVADLWQQFRKFCTTVFDSAEDMFRKLGGHQGGVRHTAFVSGIQKAGWLGNEEDLIFHALDPSSSGSLLLPALSWLDVEKVRQHRKDFAKQKASSDAISWRLRKQVYPEQTVDEFKQFLKQKYGGYVRAWRVGLSPDGLVVLHKPQFFKALANIGWHRDVRLLWKAFDKDESGCISMDELDLRSAEVLAKFHHWVFEVAGGIMAAWSVLDVNKARRLRQEEFAAAIKEQCLQIPAKMLFHGLDRSSTRYLVEEDISFLERWKPFPFLLAKPNARAKDEFKLLLTKHYKTYLKAWRRLLDKDGSNRCNWDEFQAACKKVSFVGDIPGAWRALDDDLSGCITLQEIDQASHDTLVAFKVWADDNFGGVRYAFLVFDEDSSNEVTSMEFKRACRIYGFDHSPTELFRALDVESSGTLSIDEVSFLDNWHLGFGSGSVDAETREPVEQNGCGASKQQLTSHPQAADETAIPTKRLVTKPRTPNVLKRSASQLGEKRRTLGTPAWTDDERHIVSSHRSTSKTGDDNDSRRVQPSLDLAEDVYSRAPPSRSKYQEGLPEVTPPCRVDWSSSSRRGTQTSWRTVFDLRPASASKTPTGPSSYARGGKIVAETSHEVVSKPSSASRGSRHGIATSWRPSTGIVPEELTGLRAEGVSRHLKHSGKPRSGIRGQHLVHHRRVPPVLLPQLEDTGCNEDMVDTSANCFRASFEDFGMSVPPEAASHVPRAGHGRPRSSTAMPTLDEILFSAPVGPVALLAARSRVSNVKPWMKLSELGRQAYPLTVR